MRPLSCRQARSLVAAYHDGELALDLQVSVQAHLRACPSCLGERRRLAEVGARLREAVRARAPEEAGRLERHVLARLQAERITSWHGRLNRMFEDMHLVWAAAGATAATMVLVCAVVALMALSLREQPLSMAALIGAMADPGSDLNPVSVDGRMLLPRPVPGSMVQPRVDHRDDVMVALSAVVTREGRVRRVEVLTPDRHLLPAEERELVDLLGAASQARFRPAEAGGAPVAVNLVWLVAHTTVRGKTDDAWPVLRSPRRRAAPAALPPSMPVSERPVPVGLDVSAA